MQNPISSRFATRRISAPLSTFAASLISLASCGAGTAVAVGGGGGDSSGGNAPPSMSGFTVLDPKLPTQARVRFVLSDPEANPASVEIFYQSPGHAAERLTQAGANPATLATSSSGVEYELPWNFAAEPALPDNAQFIDGVQVFARVEGGLQEIVLGANAASVGLGNDAPVVTAVDEPSGEGAGIVLVEFRVADTSNDVVSIEVKYDIVGDDPDAGWQLARPAGEETTPLLAIRDVVVDKNGTDLRFFWDTNVDLAELERDVRVRFTAEDPVVVGDGAVSAVFRVDNNEEPIATVAGDLLLVNPDERAGIPIPYTVRDDESDEVEVVFQWRRPDENFPPLPDTPAEINAILADPTQRQALHICSEYPTWVEGRVVPIDATSVRLPEIATTASSILAQGVVGREIEILRPPNVLTPMASKWASNPLNHPVAALPVADGIEALVLDRANRGSWRLRRIDLATGLVTHELVDAAPGEPNAMCLARDARSVLVASDVAGLWQVSNVDLTTGARSLVIADPGTTESGQIRGITTLGSHAALITVASSLLRIDWSDPVRSSAVTLLDGLVTPWGVVVDPLDANRIYLAERDVVVNGGVGRILSIRQDTLETLPIVAKPIEILEGMFARAFNRPESLALDRSGARLMAITQPRPLDPTRQIEAIDFGGAGENRAFRIGSGLPGPNDPIASGGLSSERDGVIIATLTSRDDLAVRGGVEQRRAIDGLVECVAHVSAAFSPGLSAGQTFRVRAPSRELQASPAGTRGVFVWDSADLPERGPVKFRAVPMDTEKGDSGTTEGSKQTRSGLDTVPVTLGSASQTLGAQSVAAADLDGDGDFDLASANKDGNTLTVFFQESPGVSGSTPLSLGDASVTNGPHSIIAADLDGDDDLDLASANAGSNTLTVFFQVSPGVFGAAPLSLGNGIVTNAPISIVAADLNGDGDLDLASANFGGDTLAVFFQVSPGVFGATPLSLGGRGDPYTIGPRSLAAADLDGDGDIDLASANSGRLSGNLTLFLQASPGVFREMPLFGVGGNDPVSVAAADIDGDGDLDLAVASFESGSADGGGVVACLQTRPGEFEPTYLALGSLNAHPTHVTAADFDGDGDIDLASANVPESTLTVFFQESPGVFASASLSLRNVSEIDSPQCVAACDFNGDGSLDLASANYGSSTLSVYLQQRPGTFGDTPLALGSPFGSTAGGSVEATDIDLDGHIDIAVASRSSQRVTLHFQDSPGVFNESPLSLGGSGITTGYSAVAADIDGDGDLDVASVGNSRLAIFFQVSPRVFSDPPIFLGVNGVTTSPNSVVAADLNSDGDLDLVSANTLSNNLTVFFQTGPGAFGSTPLVLGNASLTSRPISVAAADLNGDGHLDLVSANTLSNNLTVFFQTSPGVFDTTPLSLGNEGVTDVPMFVAAADLDGDGDLDLVSANFDGNPLTVFFQESPGVFGKTPLSLGNASALSRPRCVTAADFDGDGDLDLVAANNFSHTLIVFFQRSPGVFGTTPLSLGNEGATELPESVAAADLDGDGDPDLVSQNSSGKPVTIFWNNH